MTAFRTASIGEWLELAYREGDACPPPEAYLPEELAGLDAVDRARLEEHADGCPACASERELAGAFEVPGDLSAARRADMRHVVRRLERRSPDRGRAGGLSGWLASRGGLLRAPAFQLAAAAVLVLGVGLMLRQASPPPLGEAPGAEVMRSSTLRLAAPVGEIASAPRALSWEPVEGAARYVATVRAVDDSELSRLETTANSIEIGASLAARLEPAVSYSWQVEAYDQSGARIAWSPATTFHIRPRQLEPERD